MTSERAPSFANMSTGMSSGLCARCWQPYQLQLVNGAFHWACNCPPPRVITTGGSAPPLKDSNHD